MSGTVALYAGSGWSATLKGTGHLEWPEPVGIRMLGDPGGGLFHMSIGLQLVARLRVHLELPVGGTVDWEGNVPYVPNFVLSVDLEAHRIVVDPPEDLPEEPLRRPAPRGH